jgi:transposase-like protein
VRDEAVQWCLSFRHAFAKHLRCRQRRLGATWHLDEMVVSIGREHHSLWRAVDHDREVLDILVQKWRDQHAAKRFVRTWLKGLQYVPHRLVTDKLGSYGAARPPWCRWHRGEGCEHLQSRDAAWLRVRLGRYPKDPAPEPDRGIAQQQG